MSVPTVVQRTVVEGEQDRTGDAYVTEDRRIVVRARGHSDGPLHRILDRNQVLTSNKSSNATTTGGWISIRTASAAAAWGSSAKKTRILIARVSSLGWSRPRGLGNPRRTWLANDSGCRWIVSTAELPIAACCCYRPIFFTGGCAQHAAVIPSNARFSSHCSAPSVRQA